MVCIRGTVFDEETSHFKVLKKKVKGLFIVEIALSLSSYTGTPLKYLETNNSNTT